MEQRRDELESESSLLPPPESPLVSPPQPSAPPYSATESGGIQDTSLSSSCGRIRSTTLSHDFPTEKVAIDNVKQQLPVTSQSDDVVVSIGSIPSPAISSEPKPTFTLVEATVVDEVVCDAVPLPADRDGRSICVLFSLG